MLLPVVVVDVGSCCRMQVETFDVFSEGEITAMVRYDSYRMNKYKDTILEYYQSIPSCQNGICGQID